MSGQCDGGMGQYMGKNAKMCGYGNKQLFQINYLALGRFEWNFE